MATNLPRKSDELLLLTLSAHQSIPSESEQTHCSVSSDCSFITFLRPNATLEILSLWNPNLTPVEISNVVSLRWEDSFEGTTPRLLIFDNQQCIKIYVLQLLRRSSILAHCMHTVSLEKVLRCAGDHILSYDDNISFLWFFNHQVVILLGRCNCLYYDTEKEVIISKVAIHNFVKSYVDVQSNGSDLFLLSETTVYILSINGTTTQLDLEHIINSLQLNVKQIRPWKLCASQNGKRMAISLQSGAILLLQLDKLKTLNNSYASTNKIGSFSTSSDTLYDFKGEAASWLNRLRKTKKKIIPSKFVQPQHQLVFHELNEEIIHSQYLTDDSFYIIYESARDIENGHLRIKVINFSNGLNIYSGRLKEGSAVIQGKLVQHPLMVTNQHHVEIFIETPDKLTENIQEIVINKFIMYADTATADLFSTVNSWQSIHLPIQLLNLGLKNRLIDTVAFYLKTTCSALECSIFTSTFAMETQSFSIAKGVEELKQCIELVLATIRDDMLERSPLIFSRQLALILTKHITNLLIKLNHTPSWKNTASGILLNQFAMECMQCLFQLREQNLLPSQFHMQQNVDFCFKIAETDYHQTTNCNLMDFIVDAVVERHIPACQRYVTKNQLDISMGEDTWQKFYQIGQEYAFKCLEMEDLDKACCILRHMGVNVKDSLISVHEYSNNRKIQALLQPLTAFWGLLSNKDHNSLDNLHCICDKYPCASFAGAVKALTSMHVEKQQSWVSRRVHYLSAINLVLARETGFLMACEPYEHPSNASWSYSAYSNFALVWLKQMESDLIDLMSIDGEENISQCIIYKKKMPIDNQILQYILICKDEQEIVLLFDKIKESETIQDFPYETESKTTAKNKFRACHEFILYSTEMIVHKFSRCLPKITASQMYRLIKLSSDLDTIYNTLPFCPALITEHFSDFLIFCIKYRLAPVTYAFLQIFRILKLDWLEMTRHSNWFLFLTEVKKLHWKESGKCLLQTSVSNLCCLEPCNDILDLNNFLRTDHILGGLATILCTPIKLFQENFLQVPVRQSEKVAMTTEEFIKDASLKEYLLHFHMLRHSLFQALNKNAVETALFKMLQYNAIIQIQKFHRRHVSCTEETLDLSSFPHFSHEPLMMLNGHKLHLDFVYYLKLGRPFYAYIKFVMEESSLKSMIVLRSACIKATQIAMNNFYNSSIASACVSFLELLGQDSMHLRMKIIITRIMSSRGSIDSCQQGEIHSSDWNLQSFFTSLINQTTCTSTIQLNNSPRFSLHKICDWKIALNFNKAVKSEEASNFLIQCTRSMDLITFIVFAQFYGVQKTEVLPLLKNFTDVTVQEHLKNALLHHLYKKSQFSKQKEKMFFLPMRNIRCSLYDKIGLTKSKKISKKEKTGNRQLSHMKDNISESSSESAGESITQEIASEDFFGILVKSDEMSSSDVDSGLSRVSHDPLLLILTAFYQQGTRSPNIAILERLCVWLIFSTDGTVSTLLEYAIKVALDTCIWSADQLATILKTVVESRTCIYASQGYQKNSILGSLVKFLGFFFDNQECAEQLKTLLEQLSQHQEHFHVNNGLKDDLEELLTVNRVIFWKCLRSCSIRSQLMSVAELFVSENCMDHFNAIGVTHLKKMLKVLHHLQDTVVHLPCQQLVEITEDPVDFIMLNDCILWNLIHHDEHYALWEFARMTNIDNATVILFQLQDQCERIHKYQTSVTKRNFHCTQRLETWLQCHYKIKKQCISCREAVEFFLKQVDHAQSHCEKYLLLHLALCNWPVDDMDCRMRTKLDIEIEMWHQRIQLQVSQEGGRQLLHELVENACPVPINLKLKATIQAQAEIVSKSSRAVLLKAEDAAILNDIIEQQLDANKISEAWHLAHLFQHQEKSLGIILTCIDLAEGNVPVSRIDPKLNAKVETRAKDSDDHVEAEAMEEDTITMLENLNNQCQHGKKFCNAILLYYRIATSLQMSYRELVAHYDAYSIIKMLLKSFSSNSFYLARNLVSNNGIPEKELLGVLSEMLKGSGKFSDSNKSRDPYDNADQSELFLKLMSLCSDPAALGSKLLTTYDEITASGISMSEEVVSLYVDLLLWANEYFSLACNTEGITSTLQGAKALIMYLVKEMHFTHLVRLFTGIGRYSDMQYVFELLREHKQLDLLLKKDFYKNNNLKQALVEFINSNCLRNTEWFTMIALRFKLHRELAKMLEATASQKIREISLSAPVIKFKSIRNNLQDIQEDFTEAAKHYLQVQCYCQANVCVKKAQLIALQIHWLSSGTVIINMSETEITSFITNHSKFLESFVVARAYSVQPWVFAVYTNVVIHGNMAYLRDFHNYVGMSRQLLDNVIYRFRRETSSSISMQRNFNCLLQWSNQVITQ